MGAGFATVTEEDGVLVAAADVNGYLLAELRFPPGYLQGEFEPDTPYLALVLDGSLEKSFPHRTMQLGPACAVTMPVGATHGARFGPDGARIVIVKPKTPSNGAARLDRLVELRGRGINGLAWRLAGELHTTDAAAPMAAEGLALELLAETHREARTDRYLGRPPAWLSAAEELLRARVGDCVGLSELGDAVGVHPTHLARAFRARYGVSVGEYGRRIRLEWAASEVALTESPLALIATRAGFADQSHFSRLFKQYVGMTPKRYRERTRSAGSRD